MYHNKLIAPESGAIWRFFCLYGLQKMETLIYNHGMAVFVSNRAYRRRATGTCQTSGFGSIIEYTCHSSSLRGFYAGKVWARRRGERSETRA